MYKFFNDIVVFSMILLLVKMLISSFITQNLFKLFKNKLMLCLSSFLL